MEVSKRDDGMIVMVMSQEEAIAMARRMAEVIGASDEELEGAIGEVLG